MSAFTVLYDASVLYPAALRDLLVQLARTGLYRARWTDRIHDAWTRSILAKRPDLTAQQLQRVRELMNEAAPDCLVTGFEPLIEALSLPDPNDRHVLAAAIVGGVQVIVTRNLRHFPPDELAPLGVEAQHPDDFLLYALDLSLDRVLAAIKAVRARLRNPALGADEYLNALEKQGLAGVVGQLRTYSDLI